MHHSKSCRLPIWINLFIRLRILDFELSDVYILYNNTFSQDPRLSARPRPVANCNTMIIPEHDDVY